MTQAAIEQELAALLSQKQCTNHTLRIFVVEMILTYLEGNLSLTFLLNQSHDLLHHFASQLAPDLVWVEETCTTLAEHIREKKPHSFTEHQKIEDTLVTILQRLHYQDNTTHVSS